MINHGVALALGVLIGIVVIVGFVRMEATKADRERESEREDYERVEAEVLMRQVARAKNIKKPKRRNGKKRKKSASATS